MGSRLLFVCVGNICRSPMAEGIARALFGGGVHAESAGIVAAGKSLPSPEAVLVMASLYKTDISRHHARSLDDVSLSGFNYVIAMDSYVFNRIKDAGQVPEGILIGWDIEDPIGLGRDAYERAARKIESRLERFAADHKLDV